MFPEFLALRASFDASNLLGIIEVAAFFRLRWWNCLKSIGPVIRLTLGDGVAHRAVPVVIHHWADRSVDGQLLPIDAQPGKLRVKVREVTTLKIGPHKLNDVIMAQVL